MYNMTALKSVGGGKLASWVERQSFDWNCKVEDRKELPVSTVF